MPGLWTGASTEWPHSFLVHLNPQLPSLHSSSPPCLPIPDTHSTTYTVPQTLLAPSSCQSLSPKRPLALCLCPMGPYSPEVKCYLFGETFLSILGSIYFPLLGAAGFPSCAALSFQHLFKSVLTGLTLLCSLSSLKARTLSS